MWEDPANATVRFRLVFPIMTTNASADSLQGGKWVVLFRSAPHLLDASWANLTMALVGEILDPDDDDDLEILHDDIN